MLVTIAWTFGEMILLPVSGAYVSDLAPDARRGEYMGAYFMVASLGFMVGPLLGLLFMERLGAVALWVAVGICGLVGATLFGLTTTSMPDLRWREA